MENPGTARNNKKEGIEVNCIVAAARDLMEEIEARDSGSKDNDLGVKIGVEAFDHRWGYDFKVKRGIRVKKVNGKEIQEEGNPEIMKAEAKIRQEREKKEDRGR